MNNRTMLFMGSELGNIHSEQSCDVKMNSYTFIIMISHEIANHDLIRIELENLQPAIKPIKIDF